MKPDGWEEELSLTRTPMVPSSQQITRFSECTLLFLDEISSLRTRHCFHVVLTHTFAGHDIFNFPSGNSEFSKKNPQETCRTDQVQVTTT